MGTLQYTKHEVFSLKGHPQFNEKWVHERIAEDPSILRLGELEFLHAERRQPGGGRLDLLLEDETGRRYEVEVMLGATDPSHIIRTIGYWDRERKRYPERDHCAVLVAEDITSQFLNVIGLFNSAIPIIAMQMNAIQIEDKILLHFTKVLDEVERGDDDGDSQEVGRKDWERKAPIEVLRLMDGCLDLIRIFAPNTALHYVASHIGLKTNTAVTNFVGFHPKKKYLVVDAHVGDREKWNEKLREAGLDVLPFPGGRKTSRFRLETKDFEQRRDLLREVFQAAHRHYGLDETGEE